MKPPFIKLYVKDVICDSLDMSDEELGAYMKAFFKAYRTGNIPKTFADHSLFKELHSSSESYEKVCEKNKTNGKRGGRPKKTTFENTVKNTDTSETQWVNFGNPNETQTKPTLVNQEPITNNQEPEVKKKNIKKKKDEVEKPEDVSEEAWQGWVALRQKKQATVTELVISTLRKEADLLGWTLEQAMSESCLRNWQGFKASWVINENKGRNRNAENWNSGYSANGAEYQSFGGHQQDTGQATKLTDYERKVLNVRRNLGLAT